MGLIFVLSAQPKLPDVPGLDSLDFSDKIKHFAAYGMLATLAWRALGDRCPKSRRLLLTVGLPLLYGVSDELHQRFVPNRACDMCDLLADGLGALCAAMVMSRRRR